VSVASKRLPTAAELWRDLTRGKVVVVKHHDAGGRRYLHLRPRAKSEVGEALLSEREQLVLGYRAHGQSLKRIAFELGVSVPTVARSLASALRKLRLRSEMQLPAVFGSGLRPRG
jgi:DNA-binding NarL/FixJ family response regulator